VHRKQRFRNVGAGKGIKPRLDRETLRALYVSQRLTQAEIDAQELVEAHPVMKELAEHALQGIAVQKDVLIDQIAGVVGVAGEREWPSDPFPGVYHPSRRRT